LHLNIIIGSAGIIGKEISLLLSNHNDMENILIDNQINDNLEQIKLDLTKHTDVLDFIKNLDFSGKYKHVNIIYLAAKDKKIGEPWTLFHEFELEAWREISNINQDSLLYFISNIIKKIINSKGTSKYHFLFFPSLYNYTGPDQELYDGWPQVMKPFEYIGSKALTRDLARYLNVTYSNYNIRANCIIPHLVTTQETNVPDKLKHRACSKRGSTSLEIAEVVDFVLRSPENLMGQEIKIDGGWSLK
jgi:NADP-dependent 3-hydroxy acid dehydrogenase YdfG